MFWDFLPKDFDFKRLGSEKCDGDDNDKENKHRNILPKSLQNSKMIDSLVLSPYDKKCLYDTSEQYSCYQSGLYQKISNQFTDIQTLNLQAHLTNHKPVYIAHPIAYTADIHDNYIDSIKYYGDLVISKSCEDEIKIWKPIYEDFKTRPVILNRLKLPN